MIDSISIQIEESINAQALDHEGSMLEAYTKMETDAFTLQLQDVLTSYYQDIKMVTGAGGGRSPRSSSANSTTQHHHPSTTQSMWTFPARQGMNTTPVPHTPVEEPAAAAAAAAAPPSPHSKPPPKAKKLKGVRKLVNKCA